MDAAQGKIEFSHYGIGTLLLRDRLIVPVNQREYSWEKEHVLDLFHDLSDAISKNKRAYFLGTIVLTAGKVANALEVTDGQQRLATTTVLLAAIRDYLTGRDDAKVIITSLEEFLYKADRDLNDVVPRLTLNVDDREYFRNRVLPSAGDPRRNVKPTKSSHKKIDEAVKEAAKHVKDIVADHAEQRHTGVLNRWISFIEKSAQVVIFKVPDDLNAFVMFETLNDRGLKTNQADMLKNYLLEQAGTSIDEAQHKWSGMKGALEAAEVDDIVLTYLRHFLVARHGAIRDREVYEKIKSAVSGAGPSVAFLDELAEGASIYTAMLNHRHHHWQSYGNSAAKIRKHVETLIELRVEQIRPLMFACMKRFSSKEIAKSFRLFISWAVRFMVGGSPTGTVEKYYAGRAQEVWEKEITDATELAAAMRKFLPDDTAFESSFAGLRVSKPHLARYYLRSLDRELKGEQEPEYVANDNETEINLEHILPENPEANWSHVDQPTAEAYYRRLGNMVLLRARTNSQLGNSSFQDKKHAYKGSSYEINKDVLKCTGNWGPSEIAARQSKLAALAVKVWPLDVR